VVPHTLNPDHLSDGEIRVQMRVRAPLEVPVWVEARVGERMITRKGEPYARPGEMVTLNLKPSLLDELKAADELTLAIVKR